MTTLRSYQLRITYRDSGFEDLEFTAYTLDDAARAVVQRRKAENRFVTAVTCGDGRSFDVNEQGEIHGADFTTGLA